MFPDFDPVGESVRQCPFLRALVVTQGESFARDVAENYSKPEAPREETNAVQKLNDVAANYTLFHGPDGVLPLHTTAARDTPSRCAAAAQIHTTPVKTVSSPLIALPTASISLSSFWGDFNPFGFRGKSGKGPKKRPQRNPSQPQSYGGTSAGGGGGSGQCPMRRVLGPLATMVMSQRYHCPKPIVMMRAALAKTSIVRALRPEGIEVKLLAVALASSVLNVPFGMLREHTRKFSPEWFLVVHATIPFIAMFRKAVVMPPYAILFTVAAAIGGQAIGAKAEKRRLQWIASQAAHLEDGEDCLRMQEWAPVASVTSPPVIF